MNWCLLLLMVLVAALPLVVCISAYRIVGGTTAENLLSLERERLNIRLRIEADGLLLLLVSFFERAQGVGLVDMFTLAPPPPHAVTKLAFCLSIRNTG